MSNRIFTSLFLLCVFSLNVSARDNDNPFAKTQSLDIGTDISWKVDKKAGLAIKSKDDGKGVYYHLRFDNRQLELLVTSDAGGQVPKKFNQLEVKDVQIDGKQNLLFKWCLKNQERHNRFLQQGLKVKKDICVTDGSAGRFVMRLNKETLVSLQKGKTLLIMLKPFRTPLELHYDLGDFRSMYTALNVKAAPAAVTAAPVKAAVVTPKVVVKKTCTAKPPENYRNVKSVSYDCADSAAKLSAERKVNDLVTQEKAKEKKAAADKEKQRKLAEEKKQQEMAEKLKQEELLKVEAAAVAASEAKQAAISGEIAQKMIKVCEKYWSKGEHRCYCQKYIEHAPAEIQANSSCQ